MLLNEKIKLYRRDNGLTQQELADKLGMKRTAITEIERGKVKGTMKFISDLANLSGLPISHWTDGEVAHNYKTYEALDVLIDAMISSGMIGSDGKVDEKGIKLIMAVLEKEIALKIKKQG